MDKKTQKIARLKLAAFTRPNDSLAYLILSADILIYLAAVFFAVISDFIAVKILCTSLAGFMMAQLFVIGHDAAHKAFVSKPSANVFIARLTFLPVLHNYTLWLFAHNRLHHAYPNVQNYNSWSPLSVDEYQALPYHKRLLQKIYRSPLGFGPYYIFERWLKDKFIPRSHLPKRSHQGGWRDFALLTVYGLLFIGLLVGLSTFSQQGVLSAIFFGAVIPFIVWTYAMGLTVYQQHTHPTLKWYKTLAAWRNAAVGTQAEVTIHMDYPGWYNFITHNCYFHPAHHVNPKVPIYNLAQAEKALEEYIPHTILKIPFSFKGFMQTVKKCKLYDFERQQWLDFKGVPTTLALAEQDTVQKMVS